MSNEEIKTDRSERKLLEERQASSAFGGPSLSYYQKQAENRILKGALTGPQEVQEEGPVEVTPEMARDYKNSKEFLDGVTTSIDLEKEVRLYSYKKGFSNESVGVVIVEILDEELQKNYGNFSYLLRCYKNKQKIYELPLHKYPTHIDAYGGLICFMLPEETRFYAIDTQILQNLYISDSPILHLPTVFDFSTHSQLKTMELQDIIEFKIGHYDQSAGNKAVKLVFLTSKKLFVYPFSMQEASFKDTEKRNRKVVTPADFDIRLSEEYFVYNDLNLNKGKSKETSKIAGMQGSQKSSITMMDTSQMVQAFSPMRFLGFGIKRKYYEEYSSDSINQMSEMLLVQEKQNTLSLYMGKNFGTKFKRIGTFLLKDLLLGDTVQTFNIIDAKVISVHKILALVEKTSSKQSSQQSRSQLDLYIWELNDQEILPTMSLDVDPGREKLYTRIWKQRTIYDEVNNFVFIPEFSPKRSGQLFSMIGLDNSNSGSYDQVKMTFQILCDKVGGHQKYLKDQWQDMNGLLYSDFVVLENVVTISHGRFVTMIRIGKENEQTVTHFQLNQPSAEITNTANFQEEIMALITMDRQTKLVKQKKRLLALLFNGQIMEIKRQDKQAWKNAFMGIAGVDIQEQGGSLEKVEHRYEFLPLDSTSNSHQKIEGQILKIYRNCNSNVLSPFFLVRDTVTYERCIFAINFYTSRLERYKIEDLNSNSPLIFLNQVPNSNTQEILLVQCCEQEVQGNQIFEFDQNKARIKLMVGGKIRKQLLIENNQQLYSKVIEDQMPSSLESVKTIKNIFISDEYIYFIREDKIERLHIQRNEHSFVQLNQQIREFQVFDDQYFYWRQYKKSRQYFDIESYIFLDYLQYLEDIKVSSANKDLAIFKGQAPHLNRILLDRQGETLSGFIDFSTIKVWPLLHTNRIKVRNTRIKGGDQYILGTLLLNHRLYTVQCNNLLKETNIMTGKLSNFKMVDRMEGFQFQQNINEKQFLVKSKVDLKELNDLATYDKVTFKSLYARDPAVIKFTKYKVFSFSTPEGADTKFEDITIHEDFWFTGPIVKGYDNYGLYIGDTLEKAVYYFRDPARQLTIYYFELKSSNPADPSTSFWVLNKCFKSLNVKLSDHSPNFEKFIKIDKNNNQFKMQDFNEGKEAGQIQKLLKQKESASEFEQEGINAEILALKKSIRQVPIEKQRIYLEMQMIHDSARQNFPNFISNDEVLFMNEDNMLMAYNYVKKEESYNLTLCQYPGARPKVDLGDLMAIGDLLLGEDSLIFERFVEDEKQFERVLPNYFNEFLKQVAHSKDDNEDLNEMKFLQNTFKSKIEMMSKSCYGYIFQSQEFVEGAYETPLYIVNTFNYFQWRTLDMLQKVSNPTTIGTIPIQSLQDLCYILLPNGETIFNRIATNLPEVQLLFQRIENESEDYQRFYIPLFSYFIRSTETGSLRQVTVLDYLFRLIDSSYDSFSSSMVAPSDSHKGKKKVVYRDKEEKKMQKIKQQFEEQNKHIMEDIAFFLLKKLGSYPFNLWKINWNNLISTIILKSPEAFCELIEARSKVPPYLKMITTGNIQTHKSVIFSESRLWQPDQELMESKAKEDGDFSNWLGYQTQGIIRLKVIDIPNIHNQAFKNEQGVPDINLIYNQLAEIEDISMFGKGAVRALIELRWQYMFIRIILSMLLPYVGMFTVFFYYTVNDYCSFITVYCGGDQMIRKAWATMVFMLFFTVYFVFYQVLNVIIKGKRYLHKSSFWNICDILCYLLIIAAEVLHAINFSYYNDGLLCISWEEDPRYETIKQRDYHVRILYSIAAYFIWLRAIYFFRLNRSTGYLIRMIVEVIADMKNFLLIFIVVIMAFAHSYLILFRNNEDDTGQITHLFDGFWTAFEQTYLIPMGDYNTDFQSIRTQLGWIYFIIATIILNTMLLNLLISIISDTYARIQQDYKVVMYLDLLNVINENQIIYRGWQSDWLGSKFFFFTDPNEEDSEQEPVVNKLEEISEETKGLEKVRRDTESIKEVVQKSGEKEKYILERIEKLETMLEVLHDRSEQQEEWLADLQRKRNPSLAQSPSREEFNYEKER